MLRAREHEEAFQQAISVIEVQAEICVRRACLRRRSLGFSDGDVDRRAHHRPWHAQLVRGVGNEPPLGLERRLEAIQ